MRHAVPAGFPQPTRWATVAGCAAVALTLFPAGGGSIGAAEGSRDWAAVQLAWRDDPRAPVDVPAGVEAAPSRRPSRRAVRRAARRGMPLDNVPVEVGRPAARGSLGALAEPPVDLGLPAIPTGRPRPIDVESTLGSPFEREAAARASVLSHRDQPYGTQGHARQAFDVHLPAACSGGPLPLVVWIHGDDWRSGSKADCPLLWLVDQGYAVASIGYRLSDAAVFPAQLDDCRAALATLERDADIWGIDRQRICVIGSGAGGHLAALVGFAQPGTEPAPGEPPRREAIAAVCAIAAATHLASLGPAHERSTSAASRLVGGPLPELREAAQAASPLEHVSADDPPTLLVHGGRDADVPAAQAMRLDRALSSTGVDSTLLLLDEAGHALPLSRESAAGQGVLGFLDRVLGPGLRRESPPAVPVDPPAQ